MSIASEKTAASSERFLLVRLNPARYVLPVLNGSVYEATFPYVVNRLERNGTALTKVVGTPAVNDNWSFDEATMLLQVKLAVAPNDTTNVLIAYYYLYYTATVYRSISEDPEDPNTTIREWEPRIDNYPTVVQSFSSILEAVFTISDTSLSLINEDGQFQNYLTDDDSFYNKDVEIWLCLNSEANIIRIFTGSVQSISISQNKVSLECVDSFNRLLQPALLGDTGDEAYFRRDSTSFPNLDPKAHDRPCPFIFGSSSRYKTKAEAIPLPGTPEVFNLDIGTDAFCIDFTGSVTTANNRQWGLCRQSGVLIDHVLSVSPTTVLNLVADYWLLDVGTLTNVVIGDTLTWTTLGVPYYGIVNYLQPFSYSAVPYNLVINAPGVSLTTSSLFQPSVSIGIIIDGATVADRWYPMAGRDYTTTETATSGGHTFVDIEFDSGFESAHTGLVTLDPQSHRVSYRTSNDASDTHAGALLSLILEAGLPANTATFTAADVALPVNVRFHVPNFDEIDYDTYLKYAQDILKSTLGYLTINSSFEVEYYLLSAPSSSTVRDAALTLEDGTRCRIEYADITTQLIAYNPHNDSQVTIDAVTSASATRENQKARYLHGVANVDRFRHVLEEITSTIDNLIAIKSMRRATYGFQTATEDIDTALGGDLLLENKIVLGGSSTAAVKVITIEKSANKTLLEASDLRGL